MIKHRPGLLIQSGQRRPPWRRMSPFKERVAGCDNAASCEIRQIQRNGRKRPPVHVGRWGGGSTVTCHYLCPLLQYAGLLVKCEAVSGVISETCTTAVLIDIGGCAVCFKVHVSRS